MLANIAGMVDFFIVKLLWTASAFSKQCIQVIFLQRLATLVQTPAQLFSKPPVKFP